MSNLVHPVGRKVAHNSGSITVTVELANWAGIALMLHRSVAASGYSCSHERTGYAIAHGPSPETALAAAICKLRTNLKTFHEQTLNLPVLNQ